MPTRKRLATTIAGLVATPPTADYLDRALAPALADVQQADPATLRVSPYQPAGRPAVATIDAVRDAALAAGGLLALVQSDTPPVILTDEARELAELAADIAQRGITDPLEIRTTDTGPELIAGHRRRAAVLLVRELEPASAMQVQTVPVRDLGRLEEPDAAERVFRSNRLRENFSAWQQATALATVRDTIATTAGQAPSKRALAARMGYALGRTSELLDFADVLSPILADVGQGDARLASERLAVASYKQLLAFLRWRADATALRTAVQHATGLTPPAKAITPAEHPAPRLRAIARTPATGEHAGGYTLTVRRPIDALTLTEANALATILADDLARVKRRQRTLTASSHDHARRQTRPTRTNDHKPQPRAARRQGRAPGRAGRHR